MPQGQATKRGMDPAPLMSMLTALKPPERVATQGASPSTRGSRMWSHIPGSGHQPWGNSLIHQCPGPGAQSPSPTYQHASDSFETHLTPQPAMSGTGPTHQQVALDWGPLALQLPILKPDFTHQWASNSSGTTWKQVASHFLNMSAHHHHLQKARPGNQQNCGSVTPTRPPRAVSLPQQKDPGSLHRGHHWNTQLYWPRWDCAAATCRTSSIKATSPSGET